MKQFIMLACVALLAVFMMVGCITTQQSIHREITAAPEVEKKFAITDLVFCLEPPMDPDSYLAKSNSNYDVGEVIILYVGFKGMTDIILENGLKEAWLIEYITVIDPDGMEKYSIEAINTHLMTLPADLIIDPSWFWNIVPLTLDFVPGEYIIRVEIIDNLCGDTDVKEIKFTVIK